MDDKEISPKLSHAGNDDIGDFVELMQDGQGVYMKGVINNLNFHS